MPTQTLQKTRYERAFLNDRFGSTDEKILFSHLSGVSRAVRFARCFSTPDEQTVWNTAADVAGPAFFFFVWSALQTARKRQIDRLYFIARDGRIFFRIARLINEHFRQNIDIRYLDGSREAWFLPSISSIGRYEIRTILGPWNSPLSLEAFCRKTGLPLKDISIDLKDSGIPPADERRLLNREEKIRLKDLLNKPDFQKKILTGSEALVANATGYLRQEGLADHVRYAIVDVGWTGRTQVALSRLLEKCGFRPDDGLCGFYLGLTQSKKIYKNDQTTACLFDFTESWKNLHLYKIRGHIYETFCATDEGKTIGYEWKEGHYQPVIRNDREVSQKAFPPDPFAFRIQEEGILEFVKLFSKKFDPGALQSIRPQQIMARLLDPFINRPDPQEAEIYGRKILAADMIDQEASEIAPKLTLTEFWGSFFQNHDMTSWPEATFLRSRWPLRGLWAIVFRIFFFLKSFILSLKDRSAIRL